MTGPRPQSLLEQTLRLALLIAVAIAVVAVNLLVPCPYGR